MAPFSKPETVLKQAEGLVSVGQMHAALQSLTEMFSSKRFRSTPLTSLEPIMLRFIELCVEMRKGRTAKEGLMQYKNIAQNTSVASIETVITKFVQLADDKVREAQEKAAVQHSALDVDDLEASETPESILLGAVSGDQSKDRTDRAVVTPWLKFLWESYRTSLETLKNNARLETIYQQIAQQAFKFCLKYERKVEFRRLCETLRLHLANVAKYSHQQHSINLSDPDTLQNHLDTRFAQLNTSVELELWQEAFRSVEDVHNLLTLAKKAPRPAMMANYYEKLTKIFLMSGNALFHAAAWGRYYAIVTSIGGKSEEEMSRLAGQVLVSALAVPVGANAEPEELKGKNARLTALLGLNKMPSRARLLQDALARDVLKLSPEPVKKLYNILEVTFDPLTLCAAVAPLFRTLSEDSLYASYLPLLQRALLSRLLSQLSQVYSTIKIAHLLSLVVPLKDAGLEAAYDAEQVEAYIMGCARRGELNIRVDHKEGSIAFVDDAFAAVEEPVASTSALAEQTIQPTMSELVRTRLSKVATCLYNSLEKIEGPSKAAQELTKEEQDAKFKALVAAVEAERKALQLRRALVARRRELLSELSVRKEKEESSRRAEISRREREEAEKRRQEEIKRREIEKTKREIEEIRADEAKKYAQTLVDKGILKPNDVDKLENYDTEGLITIQVAQLEKEKKEMNERLRIIAKRIDHIERAYRKEERPLLAQDYELQQKLDKELFINTQKAHKEAARLAHQETVDAKHRLARMRADYEAKKAEILERKGGEYQKKLDAAKKKIEAEKEKRREAVFKAREEERQRKEMEEAEARAREEEERRLEAEREAEEARRREEEERRAAEEEAARIKAEEEKAALRKQRELERQEALEKARLQQQREEEAEARRAARRAEEKERERAAALGRRPAVAAPTALRASASMGKEEGVWRRSTPVNSGPPTPSRASGPGTPIAPTRSESPTPAAAGKYRPGALAAAGGGWRARMEAKERAAAEGGGAGSGGSGANTPARAASPAPRKEEPKQDDDGFTTVSKPGVWRPRRGRG
ncbi:translation initiation factor eIF3a [Coprinopsis cinerea okayama7|uniref:Eukaryotic translation initiation factor 3 subunit A n=1 Tax=Coprinopsis cinerea (strain Okayama-7 / 130 / ATCC MYA-4618 / FGSC 9003) TaxID=240176 RepID=A8P1V9_COPC7|nr:translation initiation factor eIF3a [Coprinopsis cinerea okayama7\|eukprot:XP_001838185.1 translation initiation factor eIF3a [Coprinopsis cinerea okayama7\